MPYKADGGDDITSGPPCETATGVDFSVNVTSASHFGSQMAVRTREEGRLALQEARQMQQQLTKERLSLEREQAKLRAQEKLVAQVRKIGTADR